MLEGRHDDEAEEPDELDPLGAGVANPLLRSGLALAGANTALRGEPVPAEVENGILTAEDVSGMDLSDTQLVVLSACKTGLGDLEQGEGVFGLRRAFVLAGARTLVISLNVPDELTQALMTHLHRELSQGRGRADSTAQRSSRSRPTRPLPIRLSGAHSSARAIRRPARLVVCSLAERDHEQALAQAEIEPRRALQGSRRGPHV